MIIAASRVLPYKFMEYFPKRFYWTFSCSRKNCKEWAKSYFLLHLFHLIWNNTSFKIFAYRKILWTYELCRLKFTYADRQFIPWRLLAISEESEMRVVSLVNRNFIVAKEILLLLLLERENETRKKKTHEREEEAGDRVGRSSGRGREVRQSVGGRENKRKKNDEEDQTEASGEKAVAAGPLTVCVPEKVQCPLSKAQYWRRCTGIKRARKSPWSRDSSYNRYCHFWMLRGEKEEREFYYMHRVMKFFKGK